MSQIRIMVDDSVMELLGDSPEQIERHALEMIVLEFYRRRTISAGRAASLLDMERFSFIRWSGSLGIPFFDMSSAEWREELRHLEDL